MAAKKKGQCMWELGENPNLSLNNREVDEIQDATVYIKTGRLESRRKPRRDTTPCIQDTYPLRVDVFVIS